VVAFLQVREEVNKVFACSGQLSVDGEIDGAIRAILSHIVSTDDSESKKDEAWATLCQAEGWVCRVCGSVPGRGQRFEDNLCDDCRKIVRNE